MTTRPVRPTVRPTRPSVGARPGFKWAREIISELKKVTWPSRQEALNLTTIVLIVSIAVGLLLGTIDYMFTQVIDLLLLR